MSCESQIIYFLLTESKEEDYDNGEEENNCCPANMPHIPESFELFLQ